MVDGVLGQGKDCAPIRNPGSPKVMHNLSYGGSELYGNRFWRGAGFAEFSQAEATIFENDYKPLAAWKQGEKVHGLLDLDLGYSSGWGVMATPEMVEACLAN